MNGYAVLFKKAALRQCECQFIFYDIGVSQCGDAVYAVMKDDSFERASL